MRKRVHGPGGLKGAFGAGVEVVLGRELGLGYVDEHIGCSAGAYSAVYSCAGQWDELEELWREHTSGRQLVDVRKLFAGRMLDLSMLTEKFKLPGTALNLQAYTSSPAKTVLAVTDQKTHTVSYYRPESEDVFDILEASAAIPYLYPPVRIHERMYIDGALKDSLPLRYALEGDYSQIITISNNPQGQFLRVPAVLGWMIRIIDPLLADSLAHKHKTVDQLETIIRQEGIHIIRPEHPLPLRGLLDTDYDRINASFDMGMQAAYAFLRRYNT